MRWLKNFEGNLIERYGKLYGPQECVKKVDKEKKRLLLKVIVIIAILCFILAGQLLSDADSYKNVLINSKGEIIGVRRPTAGESSQSFRMKAKIYTKKKILEKEYIITIQPINPGETEAVEKHKVLPEISDQERVETELEQLISKLNVDTGSKQVDLPGALSKGETVVWSKAESSDAGLYFFGTFMILWMLYRSRFHNIALEEKKARESIVRELPEFINKIVLLINAGVVLNTAFLRIVENYENSSKDSYFYKRLLQIQRAITETNASLHIEFMIFAKQSGVKELIRISGIITDNISKGADLTEKLKRENELLWFARKQLAEEKGRLAETKLTLPLMILLLVLIMVTIAPALMEI